MIDLSLLHKEISIARMNVIKSEKIVDSTSDKWALTVARYVNIYL